MQPLISLQDVGIRYKIRGHMLRKRSNFEALKSINLDIYPGETLGIIGRNGAGKSTLLRLISGVLQPDTGKLVNYGASVSLIALQAGLDPNLNGRDNAILGGMMLGYARQEVENRLDDIYKYSELGDFFGEPVRTYSSGMRARLGFSISTIMSPTILLVDEVLSVGDKHFKEKAEHTMIKKIQSNQTVVLVSHSLAQISRLCDRAILIEEGKTITTGNPFQVIKLYEKLLHSNEPTG